MGFFSINYPFCEVTEIKSFFLKIFEEEEKIVDFPKKAKKVKNS